MNEQIRIPKRVASVVINSLKGGVVPRIGLSYITVGRKTEIDALLGDVGVIRDGGASFRFITGKYGSGKSFLLQTVRNYVMDKNFVVADADLSPERRLHGTHGQGLATYKELIRNLSTKTRPDGRALTLILDRWISSVQSEVAGQGFDPAGDAFPKEVEKKIYEVTGAVSELVHGFDFAKLLIHYYRAYLNDDFELKANVCKWFRGEYATKSEAKQDLGVNIIISDDDWYEYIKIFALFFKKAGYDGFLVLIDELVNICKIPNSITRQYNYEKILTMYNDTLQGKASYMGIIMCATPTALEDPRRGVYSYEALRSRLCTGNFAGEVSGKFAGDVFDVSAPVIRLSPLTPEEMLVLCERLAVIHSGLYDYAPTVKESDLAAFIRIEYARIGADSSITPREVIRDFIELLNIAMQNEGLSVSDLLSSDRFSFAKGSLEDDRVIPENFAEFEI